MKFEDSAIMNNLDVGAVSVNRKVKRQKLNNNHEEDLINSDTCWHAQAGSEHPRKSNSSLIAKCDRSKEIAGNEQVIQLGSTSVGTLAVECNSLSSDSEDFFLARRKLFSCPGNDLSRKLSDELILIIFRWLPKSTLVRCAFVCKRWRQIAYDESLWTRLDLSSRVLKGDSLGHILQRGILALRLAQTDISEPIYSVSCPLAEEGIFNKLQYLDLSMAVISGEALAQLLKTSRNLLKLSLEHCCIIQDSCEAIAKNTDLEVLNMSMCYGIDEVGITSILSGCRKLSEMNLAWANLNSAALEILCEEAPRSLKRLNVSGCRKSLTDKHVQLLCSSCPHLIELDLSDCTTLSSLSVEHLCNLKKLEHVALSRCYNIGSSSYMLLQSINSLLYLDVMGLFTDQSLVHIERNLPNVSVNKFLFSSIARPTVGVRRTSIWGLKVRR